MMVFDEIKDIATEAGEATIDGRVERDTARWGTQKFKVTPKNVKSFRSLTMSYNYSSGDSSSAPKREKTTITMEVPLVGGVLKNGVRYEFDKWKTRIGKSAYFYLGEKKVAKYKFRLMKVDISDIVTLNNGGVVSAVVNLGFEEYRKWVKKKTKKTTTKSASSKSSSSKSSSSKYTGGKFAWPVPGHKRISSQYGWRICPYHGREKHSGIDIPAPRGTSIVAAAPGTVVTAGWLGSYGYAVIISHGNGLYTLYGHNSSLLVKKGQRVSKKKRIAKAGSTGNSTGPHCHFEVRKGGNSYSKHVNPKTYL